VQLDYSMPARFELTYTGADNASTPRDDHRAMFAPMSASSDPIEHYEARCRLVAPVQRCCVSDRFNEYAGESERAA